MIDIAASVRELHTLWCSDPEMHKTPNDLARYQHIIDTVRPAVVIETGLLHGGSARWWAERVPLVLVAELNKAEIDCWRGPDNVTIYHGRGDDLAHRIGAVAERYAHGDPIMVVLDSDHSTETVYGEMVAYAPYVTPGSYMVVEDGILAHVAPGPFLMGNWFDGDPLEAVERFLPDHPEWLHDSELEEMFPTTQHVGGWLRHRGKVS